MEGRSFFRAMRNPHQRKSRRRPTVPPSACSLLDFQYSTLVGDRTLLKHSKVLTGCRKNFALGMIGSALLILAGAVGVLSAQSGHGQAAPAMAAGDTAGKKFKNIQVLKDIPADQLIPSMQFISASLGVECDFCHTENAGKLEFDKDDKKEKKTAREMMQMMFAINKNNFEGEREVTCNTCHRGSPHPQAIPAILAEGPKPEAAPAHPHDMTPAEMPSGDPVLAKYIQAIGGQAALAKVSLACGNRQSFDARRAGDSNQHLYARRPTSESR